MAPADSPKIVTLAGIAAERGDVVAHPLQRRDLVEQAAVGRRVRQQREPVDAESVVDAHQDDAVAREGAAVVHPDGRVAVAERATVDPHHDRRGTADIRRPDVERQPVVAGDVRLGQQGVERSRVVRLRRCRAELSARPHAVPRLRRLGCLEPQRAGRTRRVRDAEEPSHAVADVAAHCAVPGGNRRHAGTVSQLTPRRISPAPGRTGRRGVGSRP